MRDGAKNDNSGHAQYREEESGFRWQTRPAQGLPAGNRTRPCENERRKDDEPEGVRTPPHREQRRQWHRAPRMLKGQAGSRAKHGDSSGNKDEAKKVAGGVETWNAATKMSEQPGGGRRLDEIAACNRGARQRALMQEDRAGKDACRQRSQEEGKPLPRGRNEQGAED
jgi:hypothetical protein